jgi:hypothetical protein
MIKHKKYYNTKGMSKGGKIQEFIFDFDKDKQDSINLNGISKNTLTFEFKLNNSTEPQTFKISQHTFSHFDEFTGKYNKIIKSFTHIMQYFVLFIFLLETMELEQNNFDNPDKCKTLNNNNNNCFITKNNITISIQSDKPPIYITSLYEKNRGKINDQPRKIDNIELMNNTNDQFHFNLQIINDLLKNQHIIEKNNYDIGFILNILNPSNTKSEILKLPEQHKSEITFPIIYNFSIPKLIGGCSGGGVGKKKKPKTFYKKKRVKKRKTRKK